MIARALTIAGSDPSGGAGIQADLKTFTVLRVYGMSAITALTAQNTVGVSSVQPVAADFVRRQIDAVAGDIGVDAAKTGMLPTRDVVRAVAEAIRAHRIERLVIDPVMTAGTGAALLDAEARAALRDDLLPLAALVTPNVPEAEALTGITVTATADQREAARRLVAAGARAALLKGGHLSGEESVDVLYDGRAWREFRAARLPRANPHGTGCVLSAAITAHLAQGRALVEAIERGKRFVTTAIRARLALGAGNGSANPLAWLDEAHDNCRDNASNTGRE